MLCTVGGTHERVLCNGAEAQHACLQKGVMDVCAHILHLQFRRCLKAPCAVCTCVCSSLSACLWLSTMPVEGECSAAATRSSGSSALAAAASSHTRSFTPFLWPVSSSLRSFGTWSRHQVSTCWLLDGQQQRQVALC